MILPNTTSRRVLVCGGRSYSNASRIDEVLRDECPAVVIHGGAQGADRLAGEWAERNGVDWESYPAQWAKHGRAAGPIRNRLMLVDGRPDVVFAFPGGAGTADMMKRARAAGVTVVEVS